ncbi:MAG: hypothetical protein HC896_00905 [Bacteroidales bacterium]|nr:hypothetical protein [Bacteroidales bacterium]
MLSGAARATFTIEERIIYVNPNYAMTQQNTVLLISDDVSLQKERLHTDLLNSVPNIFIIESASSRSLGHNINHEVFSVVWYVPKQMQVEIFDSLLSKFCSMYEQADVYVVAESPKNLDAYNKQKFKKVFFTDYHLSVLQLSLLIAKGLEARK